MPHISLLEAIELKGHQLRILLNTYPYLNYITPLNTNKVIKVIDFTINMSLSCI